MLNHLVSNHISKPLFIYIVVFSAFFSKVLQANDGQALVINEGETYTLSASKGFMQYERLVIGTNASLVIDASLQQFVLVANNVEIGNNAKLIAVGAHADVNDSAGHNGQGLKAVDSCKKAIDGAQGAAGNNGRDGINLSLNWSIKSFGSLQIDTRGGNGNQGGMGGNGSNVPQDKSCKDTRGGQGGAGGDGGKGGDGGNISLNYAYLNDGFDIANNITTLTNGGKSGVGGLGGEGGNGSQGYYISKKTLSGSKKWVAGGKAGKNGINGRNGSDGNRGLVSIVLDSSLTQPASTIATEQAYTTQGSDSSDRIEQLERQVKQLLKRVQALESKLN